MHYLLIPLILGFSFITSDSGHILVTVEGITHENGIMVIALFDNKNNFNVDPIRFFKEPVKDLKSITVTFDNIDYNKYAISVYHDINENGKLDKNMIGIPTEPYGFSNNPRIITGPSYEKSAFELKEKELKMNIRLH